MQISINKRHKSIPANVSFTLPNFCVITGKNGSGKTHLLEAISNNQNSMIVDHSGSLHKIQLVGFGGLNPQITEDCDPKTFSQISKNLWHQIQNYQNNLRQFKDSGEVVPEITTKYIGQRFGYNEPTLKSIDKVIEKSSKSFDKLTEDDVYLNFDVSDVLQASFFTSKLADIFKIYHVRYVDNLFNLFLNKEMGASKSVMTDDEFVAKYGPKPWDLVNEILIKAGLTYEVLSPELGQKESTYKLKLIDKSNGSEILVNDLSTGEKVLMSLALAIYNAQDLSGKPDLLILDEPDAPLHPQYSRLLIETLNDLIVKKAGVRVIMTTHSPSTVAMCPDNCLFEMNKHSRTPEMISVTRGIEVLTEGIPHLKVSIENRRQIFVESQNDVLYLERLFRAIKRHDFNGAIGYNPIFLNLHSKGSNCTDVISIVDRLSQAGNDLVRGVIDWDLTNINNHPVYVFGCCERYSIENYILDPLYLILSLVRSKKKRFLDFGVTALSTYVDAIHLTNQDAQTLCNNFFELMSFGAADRTDCKLLNDWTLSLPNDFLTIQGHEWERQVTEKFPELEAVREGNGESKLKLGVLTTVDEFPQFLSKNVFKTFENLK